MKFHMSQPIESTSTFIPRQEPNEPTENMAAPFPAKAHVHEMHKKARSISDTCVRVPVRGDIRCGSSQSQDGDETPRVQRWIIRMHIIMAAANCSPAVASRRAKYDDDFRVPTLLDAQPLDAQCRHDNRT